MMSSRESRPADENVRLGERHGEPERRRGADDQRERILSRQVGADEPAHRQDAEVDAGKKQHHAEIASTAPAANCKKSASGASTNAICSTTVRSTSGPTARSTSSSLAPNRASIRKSCVPSHAWNGRVGPVTFRPMSTFSLGDFYQKNRRVVIWAVLFGILWLMRRAIEAQASIALINTLLTTADVLHDVLGSPFREPARRRRRAPA